MPMFGRFKPGGRSAPRAKAGLIAVLSNDSGEYSSTCSMCPARVCGSAVLGFQRKVKMCFS